MIFLILIGLGIVLVILAFRVCRLWARTYAYHKHWASLANQSSDVNDLLYVALGDSAAVGVGASKPEKSYAGLIAQRLEQKTGRPVHIANISRSGARLRDILIMQLPRLKSMKLPKDAIITLDIGSNDMKNYNAESFKNEFESIIQQLPEQTIVADLPYLGPGGRRNGGKHAKKANEIIALVLKKYSLSYAQVYEHTKNNRGLSYYAADFFHPSDKGYICWYEAFNEELAP